MKTMMNLDGTQIVRVSDEKASRLFNDGYISSSPKKSNKMSKAQKRHLRKSNK